MKRDTQKLSHGQYDVLIIGGGINGAATAHMAALNGLKVALVEKNDFASGTSSKSTKLIHGGLRYLENFEFGLVSESLKERHVQLKSAPHLVHPLKFIIPVYKSDQRPFWMMKFGVWLYDVLSAKYMIEKHHTLSAEGTCHLIPGIEREGLLGGVMYCDAQMNDTRLCLENVLSAVANGADAVNYTEVRSIIQENGKSVGARVYDHLNDKTYDIKAKKVVCAVGPWTNLFIRREHSQSPPRVRTTKGIHIVVRGRISHHAILIPAYKDRRVFFIIPWMGNSLIGTTDTDYTGSPDDVEVKEEDIDYLIEETKRVLPHAELNHENIITSFAGLRPLLRDQGKPSQVSRKHSIKTSYSGLIYVMGGKYTIYRKMAQEVVSQLTKKPLVDTHEQFPVYGSGVIEEDAGVLSRKYGMSESVMQYLMDFYGTRYKDVLALIDKDDNLKIPICTCSLIIRAQVVYAVKTEMACTPEDIIGRRLMLEFYECQTGECRETIQKMLSEI